MITETPSPLPVRAMADEKRATPAGCQESQRIAAALMHSAENGADAAQIAGTIAATLQDIDAALGSIIGQRGVAALVRRSLFLTSTAHPWLTPTHQGVQTGVDLAALKSVVAQQTSIDAAAGSGALLQTLCGLLVSLVGDSLTEQLLRPVWSRSSNDTFAQDPSR